MQPRFRLRRTQLFWGSLRVILLYRLVMSPDVMTTIQVDIVDDLLTQADNDPVAALNALRSDLTSAGGDISDAWGGVDPDNLRSGPFYEFVALSVLSGLTYDVLKGLVLKCWKESSLPSTTRIRIVTHRRTRPSVDTTVKVENLTYPEPIPIDPEWDS